MSYDQFQLKRVGSRNPDAFVTCLLDAVDNKLSRFVIVMLETEKESF